MAKFYWPHLKKYKWMFFMVFLFWGIMMATFDFFAPKYVKELTNVLALSKFDQAKIILLILTLVFFVEKVSLFIARHLLAYIQVRVGESTSAETMRVFMSQEYHFYANTFAGSLVEKAKRLPGNFITLSDILVFNVYGLLVSFMSILYLVYLESFKIALIFITFFFLYVSLIYFLSKKSTKIYEEKSRASSNLSGVISDIFTNIQTVLFSGLGKRDKEIFDIANKKVATTLMKSWRTSINFFDTTSFLPSLFTIGITFVAISMVAKGDLSLGSVILVYLSGVNFTNSAWGVNRSFKNLSTAVGDTIECLEIIDRKNTLIDKKNAQDADFKTAHIVFDNVNFKYQDGERVFKNFSLDIPAGQSVGFVGKSGSGKTTLTNDEEIFNAAKKSHSEEFILSLDDAYDTKVGERGVKLSGGQRQRIGIARALLRNDAPLLIMDEATSALDSKSEKFIQDAFGHVSKDRTTIVVAHRLSTIMKLDRIIVLDKGNIVEDGTHEGLLKKGGVYAELWETQNSMDKEILV